MSIHPELPGATTTPSKAAKHTLPSFQHLLAQKQAGQKITSLTAYDYSTASILANSSLDFILVGDSLAMTQLGHANTLSLTLEEMIHHTKAVARGLNGAKWLVADLPFMSYHVDLPSAVTNAGRLVQQSGAHSVKLEGATELTCSIICHLSQIGIPVMGHIGLTPQHINTMGGFKLQGKTLQHAKALIHQALALQEAGAYAIVLEMVPVELATIISAKLSVPTIGIGAGAGCDGQILVVDDLVGLYPGKSPRFVRQYLNAQELFHNAVESYCSDVRQVAFPDNTREAFAFPAAEREQLQADLVHAEPALQ